MDGKTEEEIEMMKMMGFAGFDTTKVRGRGCPVGGRHKGVQCVVSWCSTADVDELCGPAQ